MFPGPSRDILHCTSCYLGKLGKNQRQEEKSSRQEEVSGKAVGQTFPLTVIGFFLTSKTWGARVGLSKEQKELWLKDKEQSSLSSASSAHASPVKDQHSKSAKTSKQRTPAIKVKREEEEQVDLEGGLDACQPTMVTVQSKAGKVEGEESRWREEQGRRAHITLGCAEGVKPAQAGGDLENILDELDLENRNLGIEVEGGKLYLVGEAAYLELNQPITFSSLFTGGY